MKKTIIILSSVFMLTSCIYEDYHTYSPPRRRPSVSRPPGSSRPPSNGRPHHHNGHRTNRRH